MTAFRASFLQGITQSLKGETMPVPETSRQYLPDLEARWKLSRRKILELARDGKLPLWIEFWDVLLEYTAEDGSNKVEWADYIELKFFLGSLRQLCANAEFGDAWHPCLHISHGKVFGGAINGILRDGRRVLVRRKAKPTNQRGTNQRSLLLVKYSEVFADLNDVERLDREFHGDGNGIISSAQEPRSVTDHQVTVPQTAKQGGRPKTQLRQGVEALYREKLAAGQTDILLPGNVEMFMLELRRIVNDNANDELSDKIKEHIRKVSKPSGEWVVHVQDPPDTGGKVLRKNEKPGGYGKKAVSSNLSDLRKEYPVE